MSEQSLPYLVSPGSITKVLEKIREAATPERVTQDFIKTKLGVASPSIILPYLRKIGFVDKDGSPSKIYTQFRNPAQSSIAAAKAAKIGYKKIFELNEYAHSLPESELKGLIVQITGLKSDSNVVRNILSTLKNLLSFCDFEKEEKIDETEKTIHSQTSIVPSPQPANLAHKKVVGLNLSYTINLNLPSTTNIDVFSAIFKCLKENLLKDE